ncbi:hypothetical protein CYMTET_6666 [Cymbomonas tetramitiformis]|uniref:F5/8 type C domain-containing protein n=1 Tax=Cymbomonas tetramitiformis TaxID=36881 RepID=A0AAE0GX05_9CHLO|nr:hypothetical protein CYMTET_6666 [Cymbomonas tetramitiformis]
MELQVLLGPLALLELLGLLELLELLELLGLLGLMMLLGLLALLLIKWLARRAPPNQQRSVALLPAISAAFLGGDKNSRCGAARCIDGETSATSGACKEIEGATYFCMSNAQSNPWLRLDLGRDCIVHEVHIYNRPTPCCRSAFGTHEIWVGSVATSATDNTRCYTGTAASDALSVVDPCIVGGTGVTGRYLYVRLPGDDRTITLAEVQVHGTVVAATVAPTATSFPTTISPASGT